jgi:uncharacterized protein YjlB
VLASTGPGTWYLPIMKARATGGAAASRLSPNPAAQVESHRLEDTGNFPNSLLPAIIYREIFDFSEGDTAERLEAFLEGHGWSGAWRNGIYSYHHYHSTAHEVLVVLSGSVEVQLGGSTGVTIRLSRGDAVIIPAGVAHKNIQASADFEVLGAYPEGQSWDLKYGDPGERPEVDENIARVPLPTEDPFFGRHGPLLKHWKP